MHPPGSSSHSSCHCSLGDLLWRASHFWSWWNSFIGVSTDQPHECERTRVPDYLLGHYFIGSSRGKGVVVRSVIFYLIWDSSYVTYLLSPPVIQLVLMTCMPSFAWAEDGSRGFPLKGYWEDTVCLIAPKTFRLNQSAPPTSLPCTWTQLEYDWVDCVWWSSREGET